jgi:hypothetical protein
LQNFQNRQDKPAQCSVVLCQFLDCGARVGEPYSNLLL